MRILVVASLLAGAAALRAQLPDYPARFEAFAGMNFATVRYNGQGESRLPGMAVGVSLDQPLGPWISLVPGIGFAQKGVMVPGSPSIRVNYLEGSLLMRASGAPTAGVRLQFVSGIAPEYALNGASQCFPFVNPNNPDAGGGGGWYPTPVSPKCSRRDMGFVFGGGVRHDGARMRYMAEIRRTIGSDLLDNSKNTVRNDVIALHLTAQFNVR